jgi:hypothetical protein
MGTGGVGWLAGVGLGLDLIGVVLLAWASTVRQKAVKRQIGALRASGEPNEREMLILRLTERPGWVLLGVGFLLQLLALI